jgi:pimeloyl-ACP methyl ester carboxylesterase
VTGGLHVVEAGEGPALVLVHGAMDRSSGLARVARHLPGRRVVRYDRRGYGGSAALGPTDLAGHVDDLVALLGEVGRATVVGHSFGGLVALGAAHRAPDLVAAVGAYEPPTPWHPAWPPGIERWRGGPERAADLVIEHAVGAERWARAPRAFRRARQAEGPALLAEMRSLVAGPEGDLPDVLGPVAVPAALAAGRASGPHIAPGLADLARRLGGVPVAVVDGPGHLAPTTHPAAFAAWAGEMNHL